MLYCFTFCTLYCWLQAVCNSLHSPIHTIIHCHTVSYHGREDHHYPSKLPSYTSFHTLAHFSPYTYHSSGVFFFNIIHPHLSLFCLFHPSTFSHFNHALHHFQSALSRFCYCIFKFTTKPHTLNCHSHVYALLMPFTILLLHK